MTEKTFSGLAAFDPSVIEAFVQTNRTTMEGFQRLSQFFFESARQNFDTAIDTSKRLAAVRTLPELAELQAKLSQEFFETVISRNKVAADLGTTIMRDSTTQAAAQVNDSLGATTSRRTTPRAA